MLKLTAEHGEGACYVDPHKVFAVLTGTMGQTSVYSDGYAYVGVKESGEDVARMVDEAKGLRFSVDEMLTALAWSCPSETSATEFRDHINWLRKSFGLPVDAFGVPTNGRGV